MEIDPRANAEYVIAAYVITAVLLLGYAVRLYRMWRKGSG